MLDSRYPSFAVPASILASHRAMRLPAALEYDITTRLRIAHGAAMFDTAELGQSVAKAEFKEREKALRGELLELQYRTLELARFPVIVDFAGVDGAGKSTTVNILNKWMDPRFVRTIGYQDPSEEERARPRFWRYWLDLPPKGRTGLFLSGRYSRPLLQRVYGELDESAFDDRLGEIIRFENALGDDGALILKFWMHLSRDRQKERLEALSADPALAYKVGEQDWRNHENYDTFVAAAEKIITRTNRALAPWYIVEGAEENFRHLRVGEILAAELRRHLEQHERQAARERQAEPAVTSREESEEDPARRLTVFDRLDLSLALPRRDYKKQLKKRRARLGELARQATAEGLSTVLVFEGPDAAGKGGAIRRTVWGLDARTCRGRGTWRSSIAAGTAACSWSARRASPARTSGAGPTTRSTTSSGRSRTGACC